MAENLDNNKVLENHFKEHLLIRKLARVKKAYLEAYWKDKVDIQGLKNQTHIIEKIVEAYKLKKNKDFVVDFKVFFRDFALTGREAHYLIDANKPLTILEWIKHWENGRFIGQKYNFDFHTYLNLDLKEIEISDKETISFPEIVIFLVGSRQEQSSTLSGLELVNYSPSVEFEIIIRSTTTMVEIRGPYDLARDFVSTAISDTNNPLSNSRSYFVGSPDDAEKVKCMAPVRQVIRIDALKKMLNGTYTKVKASYPGTVTKSIEVELDNMSSTDEELDQDAKTILDKLVRAPLKGGLSFRYNEVRYEFSITKTGGLFFRKYVSEDVITYILGKIKLSSKGKGNDSNKKLP